MTQPSDLAGHILSRIQENQAQGGSTLAVFDLDSTLFDVSPRTQQILHDFVADPAHQSQFPEGVQELKKVQVDSKDWGVKTTLLRYGFARHPEDLHKAIRHYWIERFFSGSYLRHDRPLEGALEFVTEVAKSGTRLVYLTGRNFESMYEASKMVLQTHGFPMGELVLKSERGADDALFKAHWFDNQDLSRYSQIYFFENEPHNIHEVALRHPQVRIVFIDSTHSGKKEALKEWPRLVNFTTPLLKPKVNR